MDLQDIFGSEPAANQIRSKSRDGSSSQLSRLCKTSSTAGIRPKIALISHVWPFPGNAGQQQRVALTLKALRELFEVHFVTCAASHHREECFRKLAAYCDCPVILESMCAKGGVMRLWNRMRAATYSLWTGLKSSNFVIGNMELSPRRLLEALRPREYSCALFEYFHAAESTAVFRSAGVPTVLDMHNILWKEREQRLSEKRLLPDCFRRRQLRTYRNAEESAWQKFDGVITINREEHSYVAGRLSNLTQLFYAPMGTDLSAWPYSWKWRVPPRVGFYGGLGSKHNQAAAWRCLNHILPALWLRCPELEFWIIGSNPPRSILAKTDDKRVRVTGFLPHVQDTLSSMLFVLCPWEGTYGFRSRLVEVMALGVPVVVTPQAVAGMEMEHGRGILLGGNDSDLIREGLKLISNEDFAKEQSDLARRTVERAYGFDETYGRLASELQNWLEQRR